MCALYGQRRTLSTCVHGQANLLLGCLYKCVNEPQIHEEVSLQPAHTPPSTACNTAHDAVAGSQPQGIVCAKLAGRFVDPDVYVPLILPYISGDTVVPAHAHISSVFHVLHLMLAGKGRTGTLTV